MNELMEIKFKILELSYKYDKTIPEVMQDLKRIQIGPAKPGKKPKKAKGKSS